MSVDGRSRIDRRMLHREARTSGILLIEDDPLVVATIEHTLRRAGHQVKSTSHGRDATRLFDLLEPDLVIIDVIMPEIDTIDAIKEFRRRRPAVTVVAISGNPHLLSLAMKHGAHRALSKPFGAAQLNALIKMASP